MRRRLAGEPTVWLGVQAAVAALLALMAVAVTSEQAQPLSAAVVELVEAAGGSLASGADGDVWRLTACLPRSVDW